MISTKFILISLTAFTVVLAKISYNNNREKVMELLKNPAFNVETPKSDFMIEPPVSVTGLGYLKNKEFGIKKPQGTGYLHLFKRDVTQTPKSCSIMIRKIEQQPGVCFRLIDNTPACHNEEYLAIDHEC